jgi:ubiquinone/menaquinone biosynthesis C-methylase UbiE
VSFADHFSQVARGYAGFRPTYPQALFDWLAGQAPGRELAWDCATGNGQAATDLVKHFTRVVATDASAAQIAQATPHARIEYRVAPAEESGIAAASVDLIAVAQALHWFDQKRFNSEARRVLAPRGVIAEWCYGLTHVDGEAVDALVQHYYSAVVGSFWPTARSHIESGYRDLPFPFAPMAAPPFEMEAAWTLAQLAGYLRTWSATARFVEARGYDPVVALEQELASHWGAPEAKRRVSWPLALRVGRAG